MLDQFIWGSVDRISPEAPVPVVRVARESFHLGGAANVVHNIRALGGRATACGIVGTDAAGRRVAAELLRVGAGTGGVISSRNVVTICKTRIVAHSQQVVRFDREALEHDGGVVRRLMRYLDRHLREFGTVVVSDYGKGVSSQRLLEALRQARAARPFRLIVDPKRTNYAHYHGITLATPNLNEAAEAAGIEIRNERDLERAGAALLERWDAEAILVTRGEQGMTLFLRRGAPRHFPTVARQVFDVTGAGDTVVGTIALALDAGAPLNDAVSLANHAAGIVVGKVGTATVTVADLRKDLDLSP
jgi:D-beta-D-heptose 7-phosphate kinase/D-beta-D-heptose 1-phosphate adenosyltransferase